MTGQGAQFNPIPAGYDVHEDTDEDATRQAPKALFKLVGCIRDQANMAKRALTDEEFQELCSDVMRWIGERIAAVEALSCHPVSHGLEKRRRPSLPGQPPINSDSGDRHDRTIE